MAINPFGAFATGLLQGYLQRLAQDRQQALLLAQQRRQILDRLFSVYAHLPLTARVNLLGTLARDYGIDVGDLSTLEQELVRRELLDVKERASQVIQRLTDWASRLPDGPAKVAAFTAIGREFFGNQLGEEFAKQLAADLEREGLRKTATTILNQIPNLNKLPVEAQVPVILQMLRGLDVDPTETLAKTLYNRIVAGEADNRIRQWVDIIRNPNTPSHLKLIGQAAVDTIITETPQLGMPTLSQILGVKPYSKEWIGAVTAPSGQDALKAQAQAEAQQRYDAYIKAGMPPELAAERTRIDLAARYPTLFQYPIQNPTQKGLTQAQTRRTLAQAASEEMFPGGASNVRDLLQSQYRVENLRNAVKRSKARIDFLGRILTHPELFDPRKGTTLNPEVEQELRAAASDPEHPANDIANLALSYLAPGSNATKGRELLTQYWQNLARQQESLERQLAQEEADLRARVALFGGVHPPSSKPPEVKEVQPPQPPKIQAPPRPPKATTPPAPPGLDLNIIRQRARGGRIAIPTKPPSPVPATTPSPKPTPLPKLPPKRKNEKQ